MSKNKLFITILLALIPFLIKCEDGVLSYNDEVLHYTFSVPKGWERIENKVFIKYLAERRNEANRAIRFDAAFQKISDSWFDFPYFLVQIHYGTASLNPLLEGIKKEQLPDGGSITDARIDKNKNCLIVKTHAGEDPNKNKERGVIVMFPGKENIVQLNYFSDQLDRDEGDINFIINSFSFSNGYGYPNPITRFFSNINWGKVSGAIIVGIFYVYFKQRKKKKPYAPLGDWNEKEK